MSPRFLWFFLGAGVGAWWMKEKKDECLKDKYKQRGGTIAYSMETGWHAQSLPPPPPAPQAQASYPPNYDWDLERARVREFSRTAGDTVAELSEATLNTILQATEALKAKMAEHRALREAERRMEEERRRSPPRLV